MDAMPGNPIGKILTKVHAKRVRMSWQTSVPSIFSLLIRNQTGKKLTTHEPGSGFKNFSFYNEKPEFMR